jgi:hypothetical protein
MKKLLLVSLLGVAVLARAQTVTLDFTLGTLTGANGSTPIADGMLIQLIAAPTTAAFAAPTPTTFTSGSEIVLWSGAVDSSLLGFSGSMDIAPAPISSATLPAGWVFLIQWFPTLSSSALTPGNGTPYGQYSTLNDASWVAPAAGGNVAFSYLNVLSGLGSASNSLGVASLSTAAAAVPEPATYAAIAGMMALGAVAYRRRQQAA